MAINEYVGFLLVSLVSLPPTALLVAVLPEKSRPSWRQLLRTLGVLAAYSLLSILGLRRLYPFDILVAFAAFWVCFRFVLGLKGLASVLHTALVHALLFVLESVCLIVINRIIEIPQELLFNGRVYATAYDVLMNAVGSVGILVLVGGITLFRHFQARVSAQKRIVIRLAAVTFMVVLLCMAAVMLLFRDILRNDIPSAIYFSAMLGTTSLLYIHYITNNIRLYNSFLEHNATSQQMELILSLTEELRRFKHNYLNILYGFGGQLVTGDTEALLKYYNETVAISQTINNENIISMHNIKNAALFNLLRQHLDLAIQQEIPFFINVDQPFTRIFMKEPALCQLLGIFLDNAREAAAQTKEPYIKLDIIPGEDTLELYIYNSYDPEALKDTDHGRGRGLSYARDIIRRAGKAVNNTYQKDGLFVQQLVVYR